MKTLGKILVIISIFTWFISCRNEGEARPKIEKIAFEVEEKKFYEGDNAKITVIAEPREAKAYNKIKYSVSGNDIIEILPESDNEGVVFKGLKAGKAVITASVNGMSVFCSVTVLSAGGNIIPYITLSNYVIECERGARENIVASLIGGSPADDGGFTMISSDQNIANLVPNNNIGVIEAVNNGTSIITISHVKAQYSAKVVVFVKERDEIPVYINTDDNVINMNVSDSLREYSVILMGENTNNYHLFRHDLLDDNGNIKRASNVIELSYANNVGTIKPKAKGIERIQISHPHAEFPMEIAVIVNEEIEFKYIDIENTLVILNEGEFIMLKADIVGDVPQDYIFKYEYVNEDDSVINISPSTYTLGIRALKKGKSVIKVKNDYVNFDREILVIVNGPESLIDQDKYITTNQNVITTEVNGEVTLTMTLVGGNSADANGFVWTVDDGSIIEVTNQHGEVRFRNRAMAVNDGEKFEATALIKAKKIGTATITLEHPKAGNSLQVTVKVYKQGVFGVVPLVINGQSIYRIEEGKEINAYLYVATGLEKNLTNVRWESDNEHVVSVASHNNLYGVLKGKKEGIATLRVTGDNLKYDYTATVIVGSENYLNEKPYIYVSNPYVSVIKGKSLFFMVECENLANNDIDNISIVNNSGDKIEMFAYRNNITVTGLELGEGEIIVSGEGLNTLKITVMVEDYALNPEKPYYLRPEHFIYGMVKGRSIEIPVDLVGGIASNEKNITWNIVDKNIADIMGNGKKCIVTGKNEGQTVLKVSHDKSNNDVEIVIYVVSSDAELKSKVIIHVPEENILLRSGELRFVSIITNAAEGQTDFRWGTSNMNVAAVRPSGDKVKAYIDAVSVGNAQVTVGYGNQIPQVIYVSVIDYSSDAAYGNVPSIVEMYAGQTVNVNAVMSGAVSSFEIAWSSADENIVKAYGNGSICTLTAVRAGKTVIKVKYPGFAKDMVAYVYNSSEEMASAYVFAGEQSRYTINKDDIVNIGLVFGLKGYPEHDKVNIRWTTNAGSFIEVIGSGASASVKGLREGIGVVSVADNYGNDIKIEVVVKGTGNIGKYYFSINSQDRIKGMLSGSDEFIEVKVFNGTAEMYNISGIDYKVENSDIIRVEKKEGGVRVYALAGKEGQSYITVTHDLVEDGKILIYTSMTQGGLINAFPIMVEKSNYLVEKGSSFNILMQTINEDASKLRNIEYGLEKNNGVVFIQERNKRELLVNAENEGSEVILVRYNAEVVQRIFVSVVERGFGLYSGYMVTENIIGLLKGQEYETRVDTGNDWGIEWSSEKSYICAILENNGKTAVLKANQRGETLIKVKSGNIERYILVFVVETQNELNVYQAVNIEQRNYRINKGGNVSINIHSFQGKVEGNTRFEDYYKYSVPYGNVITVSKADNGKLNIQGINEGVAAIRIVNEYYHSEVMVYVEVYPSAQGDVTANVKDHYITAEKTLYVIGENESSIYIYVSVLPDNFYGDSFWEWGGYDKSVISVDALGRGALVKPVAKGQTRIIVGNRECSNTLEITVIVGDRFVSDGGSVPYIYVEKDLFEVTKGANVSIHYSIMNVKNVVLKNITHQLYSDNISISHNVNGGVFNVTATRTGIARFDIKYGDLRREVYVLVKENINAGDIYLTTSENYVVSAVGVMRAINVELMGYDEIDSNKITWSVSSDSPQNVVQLVGNGLVGQIYGVSEGSVVIYVKHERDDEYKAAYPLKINVKIVKDMSKEKVVYLTTQRNVIETVKGSQSQMIYVQKVGGDVTKTETTWTGYDKNIIDLNEIKGYSAQLNIKGEGSTRITVHNVEAYYDLEIVVVVRASSGNGIYISTASSLLWLSPGEKNHRISVDLINGESRDYNKFVWTAGLQVPSDPHVLQNKGKVINIVSSNNVCLIDAINVGVAYIIVNNPKSDLSLTITVYVSHYQEIKFSSASRDIVRGEVEIVELNLPNYEYLKDKAQVWAEDLDGGITNAVDVYYTNSLVMLHARNTGHAVVKAAVKGKEGCAQMTVSVLERYDPDVNRVIIGKNLHVISVNSGAMTLNASVTGQNIFEQDNENIIWEVVNNYDESDVEKKKPLIDIIPRNLPPASSKGRTVQITPLNEGNAVLRVKHPDVTESYWKNIYIVIAEMNNRFTVTKTDVTVNTARAETVAVNIVGGTNRDYEQVKWVAKMQQKWDGTMVEVVRIMGSGREVILWPMNNGETEVYAYYNGDMRTIKVNVVSDYYFSMKNSNEFMYPGEERDLYYDITPASNNINWIYTPDSTTGPVVTVTPVQGSSPGGGSDPSRFVRVTALKEGNATVIGMPQNGLPVQVNIIVAYDYEFVLNGNISGPVTAVNWKDTRPRFETYNADGTIKDSAAGVTEITYQVCPANTYIKCVSQVPAGLTIEISDPRKEYDSKGRAVGRGTIKFTGSVEMVQDIKFQQYKAQAGSEAETPVESTGSKPSMRDVKVMYFFGKVELQPFFVRGDGKYSNQSNYHSGTSAVPVRGEQKTWLKNGKAVPGGENIYKDVKIGIYREGMTLGDGEEHYILFDKEYESAAANIMGISISDTEDWDESNSINQEKSLYLYKEGYEFKAAIVDFTLDGATYKGIRLSGGSDYIEYNRVMFNQELFVEVSSAYVKDYNVELVPIGSSTTIYGDRYCYKYRFSSKTDACYILLTTEYSDDLLKTEDVIEGNQYGSAYAYYIYSLKNGVSTGLGQGSPSANGSFGKYENMPYKVYSYSKSVISDYLAQGDIIFYREASNTDNRVIPILFNSASFRDAYVSPNGVNYSYFQGDNIPSGYKDIDKDNNYYYSEYNYRKAIRERVSKFSVLRNKYISSDGSVLSDVPTDSVYISGLNSMASATYSSNVLRKITFEYSNGFWAIYYGNMKYTDEKGNMYAAITEQKGQGGYNGGEIRDQTDGTYINYINYINPVGVNILGNGGKFTKYYYNCHSYNWWTDMYGSKYGCYRYLESHARHKLYWDGTGKSIITPYYIFNKFPYRFENSDGIKINNEPVENAQFVKLSEHGKPMPSVDKSPISYKRKYLVYQYEVFDINKVNYKDVRTGSIPVYCIVRRSHSQYTGKEGKYIYDSTISINNEYDEMEGSIKDFNDRDAHYNNDITKYF